MTQISVALAGAPCLTFYAPQLAHKIFYWVAQNIEKNEFAGDTAVSLSGQLISGSWKLRSIG